MTWILAREIFEFNYEEPLNTGYDYAVRREDSGLVLTEHFRLGIDSDGNWSYRIRKVNVSQNDLKQLKNFIFSLNWQSFYSNRTDVKNPIYWRLHYLPRKGLDRRVFGGRNAFPDDFSNKTNELLKLLATIMSSSEFISEEFYSLPPLKYSSDKNIEDGENSADNKDVPIGREW